MSLFGKYFIRVFLLCIVCALPGIFAIQIWGANTLTTLILFWGGMFYQSALSTLEPVKKRMKRE